MKNMSEKIPGPVMIERPKMPGATWDALKVHIFKEQVKKKQAQEQTQEFERLRREREQRKKEQALTLEETKSEIARLEEQLILHREGKHLLFQKLKKVIHQEQGLKDHEKSNASHVYLQPPSRLSGMGIYPRPSSGRGLLSLVDRLMDPKSAPSLKRPPAPFADEPPSAGGPLKRQRQWTHEHDDGRKMAVHASLAASNIHLREPNSGDFGLVRVSSGPGSVATNAVPSDVSAVLGAASRMAPASAAPSTVTVPTKDPRADAKIQSELSSSNRTGPVLVSLEGNLLRVAAEGEKNVPSIPTVLTTLRPNMGQQWPGMNVRTFAPRPPVPEIARPRPSFAPTAQAASARYGGGIEYRNAFVRSMVAERTRPMQSATVATQNVGTGFVRIVKSGNQARPRQPSAGFLPPNSSSSGFSKPSSEPVTTSAPFFLPSHVDPRIYAHQRDQALAHFHQQAYAAAALANLPQHLRYDGPFLPGYPTYLGIPLLGAHTNQIVDQALGRQAENYYEK